MGRPGEVKKHTKASKAYLKKTAKDRAGRNRDHKAVEKKTGKKVPKGKHVIHTPSKAKGGTDSSPHKVGNAKKNLGWRKGKKGDGGRSTTRKKNKPKGTKDGRRTT